jgi:hypothetical protein
VRNLILHPVFTWVKKLRHPTLFVIVGSFFLLDLMFPLDDVFPPYLLDELVLGIAALALASWKNRKAAAPTMTSGISHSNG